MEIANAIVCAEVGLCMWNCLEATRDKKIAEQWAGVDLKMCTL